MTTRGNSTTLRPTRYERDTLVQVWIDRRMLATIGSYMESQGYKLKHMSDILRFCIENINDIVSKRVGFIDKTAVANKFLEDRFDMDFNKVGKKNYVNNLLMDQGAELPNIMPEDYKSERKDPIMMKIEKMGLTEEDIKELKRKALENIGRENVVKEEER